MKRFVALLALLWGVANLVVSYFFVTNAFVARTIGKEGFIAQVTLLLAGVAIEVFAVVLVWQCFRIILSRDVAAS